MKLPSAVQLEARGAVLRHLVAHAQRVRAPGRSPCAGDVPHPVVAQEQPPHVGMVQETDAEVVERLRARSAPRPSTGRTPRAGPRVSRLRGQRPHHDVLARRGGFEVVHRPEPLFAPVHARQAAQEIEALGPQACGHPAESSPPAR